MHKIIDFIEGAFIVIMLMITDHFRKIIVLTLVVLFFWAMANVEHQTYEHRWEVGDIVCIQVSGERAQVIDDNIRRESLEVRTQDYSTKYFEDFELMECKDD